MGFYQILVTNALLLNQKSHLKIIDYIDVLGVSLHGSEKVHDTLSNKKGTYNNVLKALQSVPSSNYKRILNRAITNLCFLNSQYHITSDQVKKALYRFMDIEFQSLSGFTSFCSDYDLKLEKYYTEIKKRNDFIKNQQHLGRSPQYIATRLKQLYPMLNHYDKIRE